MSEALKQRAYEIVQEMREVRPLTDRSHLAKRRKVRDDLLKTVAAEDRMLVREYMRQFMLESARMDIGWRGSNSRLFLGNGKA